MNIIFLLIRWSLRLWGIFSLTSTDDTIGAENLLFILAVELIASLISLLRFSADEIVQVITGFDGSGDTGYYESTDNCAFRALGWLSWLVAILFRFLLLLLLAG